MTEIACYPEAEKRAEMVRRIDDLGVFRTDAVRNAMLNVPRHCFLPAASPDDAYAERSVTTKNGGGKHPLSCASGPRIVAAMLEQLAIEPGQRVLEVGAGTGYNAALLGELVGPKGHVTTIDVDADIVDNARVALAATGCVNVEIVQGDGGDGYQLNAPYDRIIVTVGPWDLPAAWFDQLIDGGRLVMPLRFRGHARSLALIKGRNVLYSDSTELCGFIPMRSDGQLGEQEGFIDAEEQVGLCWDADQRIDPRLLRPGLAAEPSTLWSTVTVASGERLDGIALRLIASQSGACRVTASPEAVAAGPCKPAVPARTPALVHNDSFAYLTVRPSPSEDGSRKFELGAAAHGPGGDELAVRYCSVIEAWAQARDSWPEVRVYPRRVASGAPVSVTGRQSIEKPGCTVQLIY